MRCTRPATTTGQAVVPLKSAAAACNVESFLSRLEREAMHLCGYDLFMKILVPILRNMCLVEPQHVFGEPQHEFCRRNACKTRLACTINPET